MTWLEIICHILVPAVNGWLAVWPGITRIPWAPGDEGDE